MLSKQSQRLVKIMNDFVSGTMPVEAFCATFEELYFEDADDADSSQEEMELFDHYFYDVDDCEPNDKIRSNSTGCIDEDELRRRTIVLLDKLSALQPPAQVA